MTLLKQPLHSEVTDLPKLYSKTETKVTARAVEQLKKLPFQAITLRRNKELCFDEGLMLETSVLLNSLRRLMFLNQLEVHIDNH